MLEILFATNNEGKIKEISKMFSVTNIKILTMADFPQIPKINEDGKTFKENALKKACQISKYTGKICLADDSGLEINHLKGEPGIYSSRWGKTDKERIDKVLALLENVPEDERNASFVCVLALVFPDGKKYVVQEECKGKISSDPRGKYGFGYDPIFLIPKYNKTFAELGEKIKNNISHRGKALKKMLKIINGLVISE